MATPTNRKESQNEATESDVTQSASPGKASFLGRFVTRKWLAIVLAVWIAGNGVGLACYKMTTKPPPVVRIPEISLGTYHFKADGTEGGRIAGAEFTLHVALTEETEPAARQRLNARRYRVQQEVEELLRRAHSGDFDDPRLRELKRQILEQIDETLGMRAISDVIITDLALQRDDREARSAAGTAESSSSLKKP